MGQRNLNKWFLAYAAALIGIELFLSIFSMAMPSGIWAVFGFLGFCTFCILMSQYTPASFILFSPLLFLRVTELVSGIPLEYGSYIKEVAQFGSPTGGFARLAALYIFAFTSTSIITESAWARHRNLVPTFATKIDDYKVFFWSVAAVVILSCIYLGFVGIQNGFPILQHVDRFRYQREIEDPIYLSIIGNRYIIAFLLGMFWSSEKYRRTSSLLFVSMFSLSILFSEKFTSLSIMLILIAIPRGLIAIARGKTISIRHIILYPLSIVAVTLPIVLTVYGAFNNFDEAMDRFSSRFVSQGELWFVGDRDHLKLFAFDGEAIQSDVESWFDLARQNSTETGRKFGLYYAMDGYAPAEVLYYSTLHGTGYVFSLFMYLLRATGVIGLVTIAYLTHLLYAFAISLLLRSFLSVKFAQVIIAMKLFIFYVSGGFTTGFLWYFFGAKSIALLFLFFALDLPRIGVGHRSSKSLVRGMPASAPMLAKLGSRRGSER